MRRSLLALALFGMVCMAAGAVDPSLDLDNDGLQDHDKVRAGWTDVVDFLSKKNDTTILFEAAQAALPVLGDLSDALMSGNTSLTLFAPVDEAFEKLGDAVDALTADPEELGDVLKYHVVVGFALTLEDIEMLDGQIIQTALDGPAGELKVKKSGKKALLLTTSGQEVPIYQYNIGAGEAIIHTIKDVLIPGTLVLNATAAPPAASPMGM